MVKGLIRMGIPASFGERYVVPELPAFLEENPAVRLSLQVSEGLADLHQDEIDLVMRIGHLEDSSLLGMESGGIFSGTASGWRSPFWGRSRPTAG